MACMEHACRECNEVWFDNQMGGVCPSCGATGCTNWFDEEPDCYHDDDRDYDEEDE